MQEGTSSSSVWLRCNSHTPPSSILQPAVCLRHSAGPRKHLSISPNVFCTDPQHTAKLSTSMSRFSAPGKRICASPALWLPSKPSVPDQRSASCSLQARFGPDLLLSVKCSGRLATPIHGCVGGGCVCSPLSIVTKILRPAD